MASKRDRLTKREVTAQIEAQRVASRTKLLYPLSVGAAWGIALLCSIPIVGAAVRGVESIAGETTVFNMGVAIHLTLNVVVGGAAAVMYFKQRGRLKSQRELITKYEKLLKIHDGDQAP